MKNIKTTSKKTMKGGFMCHSTAVCMANDPRSVIVPRRPHTTIIDDTRLINSNVKYSRLLDHHSHRFVQPNYKRSVSVPSSIRRKQQDPNPNQHVARVPKPINKVASSDQVFQVVVMRVSLHCQGCAGKVKKHLSKMEGVTSFSIDLETKMVTVTGHVSATGVLESVSKVKKAEFWPC